MVYASLYALEDNKKSFLHKLESKRILKIILIPAHFYLQNKKTAHLLILKLKNQEACCFFSQKKLNYFKFLNCINNYNICIY